MSEPKDLQAPVENVQRIMWTGVLWFGVAVLAIVFTLGFLFLGGWRPTVLPAALAVLWWAGAVIEMASLGLLGWSGCPILEVDVPTANNNKTRTMQFGTALFMIGGAACLLAVMLGPVR